jgi:hypothetical protein
MYGAYKLCSAKYRVWEGCGFLYAVDCVVDDIKLGEELTLFMLREGKPS